MSQPPNDLVRAARTVVGISPLSVSTEHTHRVINIYVRTINGPPSPAALRLETVWETRGRRGGHDAPSTTVARRRRRRGGGINGATAAVGDAHRGGGHCAETGPSADTARRRGVYWLPVTSLSVVSGAAGVVQVLGSVISRA